jgi:adenylosuccinate lyase
VGHSILSFRSLSRGLGKLSLHTEKLHQDLDNNWIVIAEAIQTILRREGFPNPYETLKKLTRGKEISAATMHEIVEALEVSDQVKAELRNITPFNFIGVMPK